MYVIGRLRGKPCYTVKVLAWNQHALDHCVFWSLKDLDLVLHPLYFWRLSTECALKHSFCCAFQYMHVLQFRRERVYLRWWLLDRFQLRQVGNRLDKRSATI